jgi:hypothetical protein
MKQLWSVLATLVLALAVAAPAAARGGGGTVTTFGVGPLSFDLSTSNDVLSWAGNPDRIVYWDQNGSPTRVSYGNAAFGESGRRPGRRQIRAPVLAEILQTIAPKQEPAVTLGGFRSWGHAGAARVRFRAFALRLKGQCVARVLAPGQLPLEETFRAEGAVLPALRAARLACGALRAAASSWGSVAALACRAPATCRASTPTVGPTPPASASL